MNTPITNYSRDLAVIIKDGISYRADVIPFDNITDYSLDIDEIFRGHPKHPEANFAILQLSKDFITLSVVMFQAYMEMVESKPETVKMLLLAYHNAYFYALKKGVQFPCKVYKLKSF